MKKTSNILIGGNDHLLSTILPYKKKFQTVKKSVLIKEMFFYISTNRVYSVYIVTPGSDIHHYFKTKSYNSY